MLNKIFPKFKVGEVVLTVDNEYCIIQSISNYGAWYDRKYIILVKLIKISNYRNKVHEVYDIYYNFKSFTKLPESSMIRLLYEEEIEVIDESWPFIRK